jgi:zinc-binding alcohol dehydrogenase/oxidoreductase
VVIFPSLDWGEGEEAPSGDLRILVGPDDGTYAELVKVPEANVYPKPRRFSWEEAAAFPLRSLTAYRALFSVGRLQAGETALVLGAGGGLSTFAVSLAHQAGARVLVSSSRSEKIERAKELGAEAGSSTRRRTGRRRCGRRPARPGSMWSSTRSARRGMSRFAAYGTAAGALFQGRLAARG